MLKKLRWKIEFYILYELLNIIELYCTFINLKMIVLSKKFKTYFCNVALPLYNFLCVKNETNSFSSKQLHFNKYHICKANIVHAHIFIFSQDMQCNAIYGIILLKANLFKKVSNFLIFQCYITEYVFKLVGHYPFLIMTPITYFLYI